MTCRNFRTALEEYFDTRPAVGPSASGGLSRDLSDHVRTCKHCAGEYRDAVRSRILLSSLKDEAQPQADPYFFTRLQARIREQARSFSVWRLPLGVRDVVAVVAVFLIMLGTFIFNFQRLESPNIDEAIAVDVPHVNALHPSDDHQPHSEDVMLSLLQQ